MDRVKVGTTVKDPKLIQQRRAQLVQAAVALFQEKGFHKTTTREIAKAAGFSIGTLYEYIESKEDVLYLVCQHIHDEVEQRLLEGLTAQGSAYDKLRQAITAYVEVMDSMQGEVLLIYQESQSLKKEALRAVLAREEAIMERYFATLLRQGREEGSIQVKEEHIPLLAHDIMVLGEMWAFRRWALHRRYTLREYIDHQLSLLMREPT